MKPDGPCPPDEFWWRGERLILRLMEWRLLDFMWQRDKANEEDLGKHVWKERWDDADRPSPGNISTTLSRLNEALHKFKPVPSLPFVRLEYKEGFVRKVPRKAT